MTRFARAKGSKASNERLPEEATPWGEMKKQLLEKSAENEENKKRKSAFDQRHLNYKAFLEEMEQKEVEGSKWAEFPDKNLNKKTTSKKTNSDISKQLNKNLFHDQSSIIKKKKNKLKKPVGDSVVSDTGDLLLNNTAGTKNENKTKKVKKKKSTKSQKILVSTKNKCKEGMRNVSTNKISNSVVVNSTEGEKNCSKTVGKITIIKSKKIKGKMVSDLHNLSRGSTCSVKEKKSKFKKNEISVDSDTIKNTNKIKKRKLSDTNGLSEQVKPPKMKRIAKDKKHIELDESSNLTEENLKIIEKKRQRKIKQLEKRKHFKELSKAQIHSKLSNSDSNPTISSNNKGIFNNSNPSNKYNKKIKEGKFNSRNEHQRRKPLTETMFINGKEIDIAYVDGFPVKKEDAERLKKLRKEMINKGLPRSEINIAMKLERRRAEKAFAREKKKVCFNCRKSGHNLSECPELEKNEIAPTAGSGICFKCGSTEHTHFQCKVVKGQEFKFAQCFICNEQGHIARQCPDNARGLYPKGGACKVCGDVTHLKKDCPQYQAQQQHLENSLDVETLGNDNPDIIGEDKRMGRSLQKQKPNKIIKFS